MITANKSKAEARAWTKKYFRAASAENWLLWVIKGIKDNKLISKPTQAPNQDVEEIAINDPIIKVDRKSIREGLNKIRKRG